MDTTGLKLYNAYKHSYHVYAQTHYVYTLTEDELLSIYDADIDFGLTLEAFQTLN